MEQQKLNPTIVYVLAIIGLLCCCMGGFGFILAGIAFFIATSKLKEAKLNPENFDASSVKAMDTAKTVALVILVINILYLIYTIYQISTIGWDEMIRQSQEMMEQYQNQ
ncbi:CCC motif membrane protein [Algibacter sp. R77976]|uniref:CCC motif membrane protein n=1 Tax=Algibacter sp. R77976 TaxID=3093873 RepID=UPI0037C87808